MRITPSGLVYIFIFTCVSVFGSACTTTAKVEEQNQAETVKRYHSVGSELAEHLEPHLKFKRDTEVSVYLRKIAQKLAKSTPELSDSETGVWLISERKGKWYNYGLPGNRIYLSVGLLRVVEYENEVAAALSIQLAHTMNQSVLARVRSLGRIQNAESVFADSVDSEDQEKSDLIETPESLAKKAKLQQIALFEGLSYLEAQKSFGSMDYFGPNGLFSFSDRTDLAAVRLAVMILYRAGYDARGILSLYIKYKEHIQNSPYDKATIDRMIEEARKEIAVFAPLRNPIVKTHEFIVIKKRLKQL